MQEGREYHGTRGLSTRVVLKYALLQIPGLALLILILLFIQRWVDLPLYFFWGSVILWIAKDAILFPFVWRSYDSRGEGAADTLLGEKGIAKERLAPSGYVQVRGELWRAKAIGDHPIEKGDRVLVLSISGLTLLVTSDNKDLN